MLLPKGIFIIQHTILLVFTSIYTSLLLRDRAGVGKGWVQARKTPKQVSLLA